MRKNILIIFFLNFSFLLSSQEIYFRRTQEFKITVDYELLTNADTFRYNEIIDDIEKTSIQESKGRIVTLDEYEESSGIGFLLVQSNLLVDSVDYKVANNDSFPAYAIYSKIDKFIIPRWIPIWYFNALESQDRDLILKGEPRRGTWDGDINPDVWYNDIPQISSFVLTNTGMTYYTPLWGQIVFLFKSVKKLSNTKYEVVAYPDIRATDEDITWDIYKENFPHIENGNPVKFIIEIDGKVMKVYNGETGRICHDLIQVSAEWVKLYETFVRTNNVPAGLVLPEEYLLREKTQNNKSITSNNSNVEPVKIMTVTENLKLRSGEATSTQVLAVMQAGSRIKVLEVGKAETIDGISSNWVKVVVLSRSKNRDGKPIREGTVGWCFGGYLE